MADTIKRLAQGKMTSTVTVLYTAPSKVIVTEIIICNEEATDRTVILQYGNQAVLYGKTITSGRNLILKVNSVLESLTTINGASAFGTNMHYYISGVEVTS